MGAVLDLSTSSRPLHDAPGPDAHPPGLPPWVFELLESPAAARSFSVLSAAIPRAAELDAHQLEHEVSAAYHDLRRRLRASTTPHPVRFWNFIPRIHGRLGAVTRYMVFNAGRYAALAALNAGNEPDPDGESTFPTASAVGHSGADLSIHVLASVSAGKPLENPRQIPAYRYSTRYGPRPPCFTRATSILIRPEEQSPPALLVAGTASVVGEDSRHPGSLDRQLSETFENLDALAAAWLTQSGSARHGARPMPNPDTLRAYYVRDADRATVAKAIQQRYPGVRAAELIRADICRPELLIEVECTLGVLHSHGAGSAQIGCRP